MTLISRTAKKTQPAGNRLFLAVLICLLTGFSAPAPLRAEEAFIKDIIVTNSDTHLLLYLTVKNCFTGEMENGISKGIPATFTYYVDLYENRRRWPDRKIASLAFNRSLSYDNLKEEYRIDYQEKNKLVVVSSLAEAKTQMAEINGLNVIRLTDLDRNSTYRIMVKAKLAKKTLPLYFHYLIPITSLWDFETDWHTLEFKF